MYTYPNAYFTDFCNNITSHEQYLETLQDKDNLKEFINKYPYFFSIFKASFEQELSVIFTESILILTEEYAFNDNTGFIDLAINTFIDSNYLNKLQDDPSKKDGTRYEKDLYYKIRSEIEILQSYYFLVDESAFEREEYSLCFTFELKKILKRIYLDTELFNYLDIVKKRTIMQHNLKDGE